MPEKQLAFLYKPLCLADGLFISQPRGKSRQVSTTWQIYGDEEIKFDGNEALRAFDLLVLQGIAALAYDEDLAIKIGSCPESSWGQELRSSLKLSGKAYDQQTLGIDCGSRRLLKEIGRTAGGGDFASLRKSLERMSNVTLAAKCEGVVETGRLIGYTINPGSGLVSMAIHPRLASAIDQKHFAVFDMREVRLLESDAARLIHGRICGWLDQGKSSQITLETVCKYVWPFFEGSEQVTYENVKRQRQTASRAIAEIVYCLKWYPETYRNMNAEEIMKCITSKTERRVRRACKQRTQDTKFKLYRPARIQGNIS